VTSPSWKDHAGMPLSGKICKCHQKSGLKDFEIILFKKVALYIHTTFKKSLDF
jgi:hypothetical protein